ncbi:hypothetical protein PC121_g23672 [Phytophthora cactorum]|nr:hypothetical protein PC120_g26795 [Phytophthora cactorum]KAG3039805.1 hypothetical protein PC121_g23672 [Phytophthora cactorum]
MVHLAAVPAEVTAVQTARLFVDMVFKHHGMPLDIVPDRDPRFTARFWQEVFALLRTQLSMSTADHPQTDGQTERVNRVLGDLLKSYAHSFQQWSDCLSMAEFAINNLVHASTGHTPFYVNAMRHPRLPSMLGTVASSLSGGGSTVASEQPQKSADTDTVSAMTTRRQSASRSGNETTNKNYGSVQGTDTATKDNTSVQGTDSAQAGPAAGKNAVLNKPFSTQAMDFVQRRQAVIRFVQDAIAASVDRQKLNADNVGRGNTNEFEKGSLVLLATQNLPRHAVSDFGASKLALRFIGPFTVIERHGNAYTLDIPSSMRLHPTFYVGRRRRSGVSQLLESSNTVVEPHDLRSKFHLDIRRGLSGLCDLRLQIAQLLLQLGDRHALEKLQSGYTVVQSARVTANLGLTVRGVSFRPRRHHCAMRAARLGG